MEISVQALQDLSLKTLEYATLENGLQLVVIAIALLVGGGVLRYTDRLRLYL